MMIGTSDQSCWLAEACKFFLFFHSHESYDKILMVQDLRGGLTEVPHTTQCYSSTQSWQHARQLLCLTLSQQLLLMHTISTSSKSAQRMFDFGPRTSMASTIAQII